MVLKLNCASYSDFSLLQVDSLTCINLGEVTIVYELLTMLKAHLTTRKCRAALVGPSMHTSYSGSLFGGIAGVLRSAALGVLCSFDHSIVVFISLISAFLHISRVCKPLLPLSPFS